MKHTQQSAHGGARDRRDGERRIRNKKMCSLCSIGSCCCRCRWCCCCYYCSSTRSTFQVSLRRINFHMQLTRYSGNFSFSAQIICFSPFLKMILCSSLTAFVTDCSTNRLRDEWKWCAPIHLVNNKSIYFWVFFSFFFSNLIQCQWIIIIVVLIITEIAAGDEARRKSKINEIFSIDQSINKNACINHFVHHFLFLSNFICV